jgi:hypothetical protein
VPAPRKRARASTYAVQNAGSTKMGTNATSARVCINASKLSSLSSAPYIAVSQSVMGLAETVSRQERPLAGDHRARTLFGGINDRKFSGCKYYWEVKRTSFVRVHALGQCLDTAELSWPKGALSATTPCSCPTSVVSSL